MCTEGGQDQHRVGGVREVEDSEQRGREERPS